jgi:hypothetical protein
MTLLSEIYDVTLKRPNRGASAEGWIRPTVGEYYETTYDFKHVPKSGSKTRTFGADEEDNYILTGNDASLEGSVLTIPNNQITSINKTPVRERVYLVSDWNYSTACETPTSPPTLQSGQYGILTIGVEKASGSTVPLTQADHARYAHAFVYYNRMYSSFSRLFYNGTPRMSFQTTVTSDGVVQGKIYCYANGGWCNSNTYQLSAGDKLYIEHSGYARPDYQYGDGMPLYGIDVYGYPINTAYTAETTGDGTIDNIAHTVIESLSFNYSQPSYTTILALVSFDGKNTWKKWNGSEFVTETDITAGNTLATMSTGMVGFEMESYSSMDFKFYLSTTNAYYTPVVRSFTLSY